ncbi:MAG: hypothetical protein HYT03_01960 [Candidatus Harrisonbacteria bacterium]|nr:hypothetical protein [Candidatus Harrisonbacteria bacterium]
MRKSVFIVGLVLSLAFIAVVFAQGSGNPRKESKAATFAISVKVLGFDEAGQKIKGVGTGGSYTGRDLIYEEREFDLSEADLRNLRGDEASFQDVANAQSVFIHGVNHRNGNFKVNKVVIEH